MVCAHLGYSSLFGNFPPILYETVVLDLNQLVAFLVEKPKSRDWSRVTVAHPNARLRIRVARKLFQFRVQGSALSGPRIRIPKDLPHETTMRCPKPINGLELHLQDGFNDRWIVKLRQSLCRHFAVPVDLSVQTCEPIPRVHEADHGWE